MVFTSVDIHCIPPPPTTLLHPLLPLPPCPLPLPQCSELGDVLISLCYSPSLQRLSVVVLRGRGLQLLTDAGV